MSSSTFGRLADVIATRLSEVLGSRVTITTQQREPIASSPRPDACAAEAPGEALCVPATLLGQPIEVLIERAAEGETLSPRLALGLVDLVVRQTTVVDRLPNQHEVKNSFIHRLLHGYFESEDEAWCQAQILGMDFSRPRAVILIDASDYILAADEPRPPGGIDGWLQRSALRARLIISSVVRFFELPDETICAYIGDGEVAILKASTTQDLGPWAVEDAAGEPESSWANLTALKRAGTALLDQLRRETRASISLGVGRYHPGIRGLARSYQDARAALLLGNRFHGQNRVHCLDSLGVAAFVGVADERTKLDLAMHLLSPLDQEPELLETLEVFFAENCSPSATARRLIIHRNTLTYRFDKIASLTGLDPRQFDDAVQIRLALVLRSLQRGQRELDKRPRIGPRAIQESGQTSSAGRRAYRSA